MAQARKKRTAPKKSKGAKKKKTAGRASRRRVGLKKAARVAFHLGGED